MFEQQVLIPAGFLKTAGLAKITTHSTLAIKNNKTRLKSDDNHLFSKVKGVKLMAPRSIPRSQSLKCMTSFTQEKKSM